MHCGLGVGLDSGHYKRYNIKKQVVAPPAQSPSKCVTGNPSPTATVGRDGGMQRSLHGNMCHQKAQGRDISGENRKDELSRGHKKRVVSHKWDIMG